MAVIAPNVDADVDGLGYELFEICGVGDAGAVAADAAEVGEAVGFGGLEAVDGFGEHQRQGVFTRAARAGEDERMRETLRADSLAQVRDRRRVAEEIPEAHGLSLWHLAGWKPGSQKRCPSTTRRVGSSPHGRRSICGTSDQRLPTEWAAGVFWENMSIRLNKFRVIM